MDYVFGIICLILGILVFRDSLINNKKIFKEFKEMKSDLGVSYYKGWIAALGFIILGVLLLLESC